VGAELFHAKGRTDVTILIVFFFSKFCKLPNKDRESYFEEAVRGLILDPLPVLPWGNKENSVPVWSGNHWTIGNRLELHELCEFVQY